MKCKDMDSLLDDHRVSRLTAVEKAEVASHLEQCRRCADAWLHHEALVGESPAAPRAGFYAEALAAAVAGGDAYAEAAAATGGSHRWRTALGLAAAAVIVAGLVWFALPGEKAAEQGAAPAVADDSAASPSAGFLGDTPARERESGLAPDIAERLNREAQTRSQNFVAGVHYERLPVPAPTTADAGRVEVCEFFMFGCIHCYNFEPILTSWVESHSDTIKFVRVPALFNDLAVLHAQAYYTAEALGVVDDIVGPFYAEIHERGQGLASVDEIRKLFASYGIDSAIFDATFASAEVRASLRRAEELNRLYDVDSTPMLGVAGKYRTSVSMAGSNEALFDVVDTLAAAESAGTTSSASPPCEDSDRCSALQKLIDEIRQHAPPGVPADGGQVRF